MNLWLPQMDLHITRIIFWCSSQAEFVCIFVCCALLNFCLAVSVSLSVVFGALRWMRRSGLLSGLHSGLSSCLISVRFSSELCDPHPPRRCLAMTKWRTLLVNLFVYRSGQHFFFFSDNYTFTFHVGTFFRGKKNPVLIHHQFLPVAKTFLLAMTSRCWGTNANESFDHIPFLAGGDLRGTESLKLG